jgi:hypothetical protein
VILMWLAVPLTVVVLIALALRLRANEFEVVERRNRALDKLGEMKLTPRYQRSLDGRREDEAAGRGEGSGGCLACMAAREAARSCPGRASAPRRPERGSPCLESGTAPRANHRRTSRWNARCAKRSTCFQDVDICRQVA